MPYTIVIGVKMVAIGLVLFQEGPAAPPDPRSTVKIEAAVRATFPRLCAQRNHRMIIEPALTDTKPDSWEIHCDPNPIYLPKDTPMLTINIVTCDVKGLSSLTLMEDFPELFNTPKLANCPWQ